MKLTLGLFVTNQYISTTF